VSIRCTAATTGRISLCRRSHLGVERKCTFITSGVGLAQRVVAMLAEIFMLRVETAPRLQEQTGSLSVKPFVPFTHLHQFVLKDRTTRPADRPEEAGSEEVS
jgi:hypothetical protein